MKALKILSVICLVCFVGYAKAQLVNCPGKIGKSEWELKNNAKYTEFTRFTTDGKRMIYRVYTANAQFSTGLKTAEFVFGADSYCSYCYYEFSDMKYLNLIENDINADPINFRRTGNQNEWRNDNGRYVLQIVVSNANSFTVVYRGDGYVE